MDLEKTCRRQLTPPQQAGGSISNRTCTALEYSADARAQLSSTVLMQATSDLTLFRVDVQQSQRACDKQSMTSGFAVHRDR